MIPDYTEASFTRQVIALARIYGWRVAHFRPARTARGWRTPVQGDAAGFPDLVLLRGRDLIVAELKVGRNRPRESQRGWLDAFRTAGIPAYVWRPDDWDTIEQTLR